MLWITKIPLLPQAVVGAGTLWAAGDAAVTRSDPLATVVAILSGSALMGVITLFQKFKMAELEVKRESDRQELANLAETRKIELSSLTERVDRQEGYIRDLETQLRDTAVVSERNRALLDPYIAQVKDLQGRIQLLTIQNQRSLEDRKDIHESVEQLKQVILPAGNTP